MLCLVRSHPVERPVEMRHSKFLCCSSSMNHSPSFATNNWTMAKCPLPLFQLVVRHAVQIFHVLSVSHLDSSSTVLNMCFYADNHFRDKQLAGREEVLLRRRCVKRIVCTAGTTLRFNIEHSLNIDPVARRE